MSIYAVVTKDGVYILDMAAKIDSAADYICKPRWGDVEFPPPFGREAYPEVQENKGHGISHNCQTARVLWLIFSVCLCVYRKRT